MDAFGSRKGSRKGGTVRNAPHPLDFGDDPVLDPEGVVLRVVDQLQASVRELGAHRLGAGYIELPSHATHLSKVTGVGEGFSRP
ncbi:hypothetical protein [Amycolatopsis sp. NPDC052450]|uniref:hypothetical protein n=1 Tax=Amycolatopsis sp. NPDC052450 TaxID=3363937 RepID=UPI0037C74F59